MPYNYYKKTITVFLTFLLTFTIASAQSIDEIKQNIDTTKSKVIQLEQEIKVYEKQIEAVGTEAKSLQNAVKVLDINQKKILKMKLKKL